MRKTLSNYKLMTVAVLGYAATGNAEIIYTDVDPDQTFTENGDSYELDLNNDGDIDFTINVTSSSFAGSSYIPGGTFYGYSFSGFTNVFANSSNVVGITPANGNGVYGSVTMTSSAYGGTNTNSQIRPLKANLILSPDETFIEGENELLAFQKNFISNPYFNIDSSGVDGNFNDTIFDRFLGVKFKEGSTFLYGWARVSIHVEKGSQSFTIYDYAYEDSGDPIYSGAGIVSPGSLSLNDDLAIQGLRVQNLNGQIYISSDYSLIGKVILLDISGATIQTKTINGKELILNTENKATGTYLVQVVSDDGKQTTKKVIL